MTTAEAFAPAKINLTLHVTGRRPDGYHLLDSLVVFADVGDRVAADEASSTSFHVTGPYAAGVPGDGSNLVLRAAGLLPGAHARIMLQKNLPPASGIGGGSADAAATLRVLAELYHRDMPPCGGVLGLGADVPVCLHGKAVRMGGIGETLAEVPALPRLSAILINPGVVVPTPLVFRALQTADNAPMGPVPEGLDVAAFANWLAAQRNDLQAPACAIAPAINNVLSAITAQPGCLFTRMSGSGATCFGLFGSDAAAMAAARIIGRTQPDWWAVPTVLG